MKYEYLKEYKTSEGNKAVYLGKDDDGDDVFVIYEQGGVSMSFPSIDGIPIITEKWTEPVAVEGWINVYSDGLFAGGYELKRQACAYASPARIDCRKIRYTEGVGIEDVTGEVSDEG